MSEVARLELSHRGYTVIRNFLPDHLLGNLRLIVEQVAAEHGIKDIWNFTGEGLTEAAWSKIRGALSYERRETIEAIYNSPDLTAAAADVLNGPVRLFPVHKLRISVPDVPFSTHGWHQDEWSWPKLRGRNPLSFWVPLMPVDERNSLGVIPVAYDSLLEHDALTYQASVVDKTHVTKFDTPKLAPGDAIVFGPFTLHGTVPNTSGKVRVSVDFRYELKSNGPLPA